MERLRAAAGGLAGFAIFVYAGLGSLWVLHDFDLAENYGCDPSRFVAGIGVLAGFAGLLLAFGGLGVATGRGLERLAIGAAVAAAVLFALWLGLGGPGDVECTFGI